MSSERKLGDRLELNLTPGFGGMGMSSIYGKTTDEESRNVLRHAIEIGVTLWDTHVHFNFCTYILSNYQTSADIYGCGHNETLIGSVLKENDNRSKVFLCTKFGNVFDRETGKPTGTVRGDAAYIRQSIDESIARLGFTPDLYYQHRVDPKVPIEETYSTLEELRREGKFTYIGISEPSEESLRKAAKVAKISALQIEYSPWTTDIERNGLLAAARELGITIVAYSPLGRGFLTGRYKSVADFDPSDRRLQHPRFAEENWQNNFNIVQKLQAIAEEKGITPAQLALAWVSAQGEDIIPIPGTTSIARLDENWKSSDVHLTTKELQEIREVVDKADIKGDRYPPAQMKAIGK
ncbi:Aldo/keto reductase [Hysterangium stoloniferum]|nr:Aldo/keto reductase [Hysterangium stoloniferum]